jgi:RNA polymerase sigma-70 factor (ECF subfamily)
MTFKHNELVHEIDKLRQFARKLCRNRDEAEDLLQATVLRALEKKHLFESGTDLFAWTSKMMFNLFATQYRRRVKFETQYDCEELIKCQAVEASQEKKAELQRVGEVLQNLSEDHRDVLLMVCVHGMAYEQVAGNLNIPVGTVRSRLSRARERLKSQLEEGRQENSKTSGLSFNSLIAQNQSANAA